MDETTTDAVLESLRQHMEDLEQSGVDPDTLTERMLSVTVERCVPPEMKPMEGVIFDKDEIALLALASRLAAKRSERRGSTTDPILALLAYASEQALALLGREKLRSVLEGQCAELTCPADFWGKG